MDTRTGSGEQSAEGRESAEGGEEVESSSGALPFRSAQRAVWRVQAGAEQMRRAEEAPEVARDAKGGRGVVFGCGSPLPVARGEHCGSQVPRWASGPVVRQLRATRGASGQSEAATQAAS